jgi:hypothetical protein
MFYETTESASKSAAEELYYEVMAIYHHARSILGPQLYERLKQYQTETSYPKPELKISGTREEREGYIERSNREAQPIADDLMNLMLTHQDWKLRVEPIRTKLIMEYHYAACVSIMIFTINHKPSKELVLTHDDLKFLQEIERAPIAD